MYGGLGMDAEVNLTDRTSVAAGLGSQQLEPALREMSAQLTAVYFTVLFLLAIVADGATEGEQREDGDSTQLSRGHDNRSVRLLLLALSPDHIRDFAQQKHS
jgi:hypothetical protein